MAVPDAEGQVRFLTQLQRLLDEGSFVASYKFALLLALAGVCVERGDDSGDALVVSLDALAEQFIRLYWRQCAPYVPGTPAARAGEVLRAGDASVPYTTARRSPPGRVLQQNTGRQAAVLNAIALEHGEHRGSLLRLRSDARRWRGLKAEVARTIRLMPLWRLQVVGKEKLEVLYRPGKDERHIRLLPGVAFCFRRFHGLVQDLVQGAWLRFVRGLPANRDLLGQAQDLGSFLFGGERGSLALLREPLRELQHGECFYCEGGVRDGGEVDHFIPWARYSFDLGHNFVLAHADCNQNKSDRIAACVHLDRWCERNALHARALEGLFTDSGIALDLSASQQIARWAYAQTEQADAQVWVKKKDVLAPLDPAWRRLPGMAAAA